MMQPIFLWSRAGMGGADALLASLLGAVARGERCYWLVPEPYSHATERLLAERGGAPVCLNAEVLTFRRLTDRILSDTGGIALPVLDAGGRLLVLRRALRQVSGRLTALSAVAARPGYLPGLLQTLDECKCYRVTPSLLEKAGAEAPGAASGRLFDLALILSAYDMLCAQGALDPRDRMSLAREKIISHENRENARIAQYKDVHIYVSHFASFTPQERLLLMTLADNAASFNILLCGELNERGFDPLRKTARQITAHFPQGVQHIQIAEPEPGRAPALGHMERHWFDRKPPVFDGEVAGTIELWAAPDEAAEARFAAERVLQLVREGHYRWRDIAVIASDYQSYGQMLESAFMQYGVPFFADSMDEMAQKPLTRAIRAAAHCVARGYRADDVMSLLRTGLLPFSEDDADLMENYLRRWNMRGSRFSGAADWIRPSGGYHKEPDVRDIAELARLNAVRRHISSALKKLSGGKTARECAKNLYDTLEALGVREGHEARERTLIESGEDKFAAECAQMWELFCKSLEQCVGALGDEPMEFAEFCELCLTVLSGYTVGSIPASLDRVHAGDQGRFPRIPKPVVIYIGASSEKIPARGGGSGLLATEERAALEKAGCELPPDPAARIGREMLQFYTACTLPCQKLILTIPLSSDGKLRLAEEAERISRMFALTVKPVPPPRIWGEPLPQPQSSLSPRHTAALYGQTLLLSASRVEAFYRCPFSYFLRYGLRAKRRPEPGFTPLDVGLELHAVLEQCARFAAEHGGFSQISKTDIESFALESSRSRDVFSRGGAGTPRLLAQGERLARTAAMLAGRMWEEFNHSRFEPLDFELYLEGEAVSLHGHGAETGTVGAYKLRGVADRVDGYRSGDTLYLRVADYKTGGKSFSLRDVYHGIGAQMPLYLFLLKSLAPRRYGVSRAEAAGLLYVPSRDVWVRSDKPLTPGQAAAEQNNALRASGLLIEDAAVLEAMDDRLYGRDGSLPVTFNKDGSFHKKTLVASPGQMDMLQSYVGGLVRDMARKVADGEAQAYPLGGNPSPCEFCDFRGACRFDKACDPVRPLRGFAGRDEFFEALAGEKEQESCN